MAWRLHRFFWLFVTLLSAAEAYAAEAPPFVVIDDEPSAHAWFLRLNITPNGTEILGVPVQRIHAAWCHANAYRARDFGDFQHAPHSDPPLTDGMFRLSGALPEVGGVDIVTGAYARCDGQTGGFVLVMSAQPGQPQQVLQIIELDPGRPQFQSLSVGADLTTFLIEY